MPPSTHNSRRSGIPLSQFAAPVSPALLPPVFENSRYGDIQPHTGFARLITATEILLGVLLLLFGFSAIIGHRSDWRNLDDQG